MHLDAIILARLQFAFTIAWHIIFPSFTIGLASYLAVLEGLWLITRREAFDVLYRFWIKIFALSFGMGVVSGVVMSYEFGTNWSVFAAKVSPAMREAASGKAWADKARAEARSRRTRRPRTPALAMSKGRTKSP